MLDRQGICTELIQDRQRTDAAQKINRQGLLWVKYEVENLMPRTIRCKRDPNQMKMGQKQKGIEKIYVRGGKSERVHTRKGTVWKDPHLH